MHKRFDRVRRTWNYLGASDPLFAILSEPQKRGNRWELESFFATGQKEIDAVLRVVSDRFPDVPRGCALDFGCGVGRLTRALANHFERIIGIDVAASMINRARELNADTPGCEFVLNERADLSLVASGSVDFLYSNIVLQHIDRPYADRYLREFVRVLSPQGLAIFQIPYEHSGLAGRFIFRVIPQDVVQWYWRLRQGRHWVNMISIPVKHVQEIVSDAGGKILQYEESGAGGNKWRSKLYCMRRSEPEKT